jgi:hypothetical protein
VLPRSATSWAALIGIVTTVALSVWTIVLWVNQVNAYEGRIGNLESSMERQVELTIRLAGLIEASQDRDLVLRSQLEIACSQDPGEGMQKRLCEMVRQYRILMDERSRRKADGE